MRLVFRFLCATFGINLITVATVAWISRSLIALFATTISTMADSCSTLKIFPLPPVCGVDSIKYSKSKKHVNWHYDSHINGIDDTSAFYLHSTTYLFSFRKSLTIDATVLRLRMGWTLCPASLKDKPWLMTWSIIVARISFETWALFRPLAAAPPPRMQTPLPRAPLPSYTPSTPLASLIHVCK